MNRSWEIVEGLALRVEVEIRETEISCHGGNVSIIASGVRSRKSREVIACSGGYKRMGDGEGEEEMCDSSWGHREGRGEKWRRTRGGGVARDMAQYFNEIVPMEAKWARCEDHD